MRTSPIDRRYALHDRLCLVRATIGRAWRTGIALSDAETQELLAQLSIGIDETIALYSEISARRWNERAAYDPVAEIVLAEAAKPAGQRRVVLFPLASRPVGAVVPLHPTHDQGDDCA